MKIYFSYLIQTGAILATLAFVKKIPLRECAEKYKEFGKKVFASKTGDKDVMFVFLFFFLTQENVNFNNHSHRRSDSNWTKFMNYVNWMSSGGVYRAEEFVAALNEVCGGERMIDLCKGLCFYHNFFLFLLTLNYCRCNCSMDDICFFKYPI